MLENLPDEDDAAFWERMPCRVQRCEDQSGVTVHCHVLVDDGFGDITREVFGEAVNDAATYIEVTAADVAGCSGRHIFEKREDGIHIRTNDIFIMRA
jgi:hypothetical protein